MDTQAFLLTTREEIQRFETLLLSYVQARANFALPYISLVEAFDLLGARADREKIFTALLDIVINLHLVWCDQISSARAWSVLSDNDLADRSILDGEESFSPRMDMHRYSSSYIFRYRALWDKVMGFFILYFDSHRYEEFAASKSKRRTFRKIASAHGHIPTEYLATLESLLTDFDKQFRSPEAHGTGSLRKWSLSNKAGDNNPQKSLIPSWNGLSLTLILIGSLFNPSKLTDLVKSDCDR